MRGESEKVMKIAKAAIHKEIYKKLKEIQDEKELTGAAKKAIINDLEKQEDSLRKKIQYLKNYGKDVFFAENKLLLLDSKIKHFKATTEKEDYIKASNLIINIKKEIENVQSIKSV